MTGFTDLDRTAQVAWAAGFFQGEGYAGLAVVKRKTIADYLQPEVKITQYYDRTPLDKFQSIFDVGNVLGPYDKARGDTGCYQYFAGGKDAIMVCETIFPHLLGKKTEQVGLVLARHRDFLTTDRTVVRGTGTHCKRGHDYATHARIRRSDNSRICRVCETETKKRWRQRVNG